MVVTPFVNSIGPACPLPASIFESMIFLFPSWDMWSVTVPGGLTVSHLPGGCLQQKETQASGAIVTLQMGHYLVGGFNPFKNISQNGFIFPNFRGEHKKIFELPPPSYILSRKFRNKSSLSSSLNGKGENPEAELSSWNRWSHPRTQGMPWIQF